MIHPSSSGITPADIALTIRPDDTSTYSIGSLAFQPTQDYLAPNVYGKQPRCTDAVLGPASILNAAGYSGRGISNTQPDRFAHLAVHYARAYDAFEFVRDGLGKPGFQAVRVNGWDSRDNLAYACDQNAILVGRDRSTFFNANSHLADLKKSAVFAMRHEYGHHFMCASPIGGVNQIPPLAQGDTAHQGLENDNCTDAWKEGFATYFAAAVAEFKGEYRPYVQMTKGGELNLRYGGEVLDFYAVAGEQRKYGNLIEEFAVAGLLWDLSAVTGSKTLLDSLESNGQNLIHVSAVYSHLKQDFPFSAQFIFSNCSVLDTGAVLSGIDCLFIDRGFYHDLNGDGFYGPGEEVGVTRWVLASRGPSVYRPNVPAIEGSTLRLNVFDRSGQALAVEGFMVAIEYDPPLAQENSAYLERASGNGPYEFPVVVPGTPSRAVITPVSAGREFAPPLVIESDDYHERIDPFRAGGVSPILAEHTFNELGGAARFEAGALELVPEKRKVRNPRAYPYRVELINNGPAVSSVIGVVTSTDPHTVVADGVVRFKDVPAYGRVFSVDPFNVLQDRDYPFNPDSLRFSFTASP